jgi:hypothetical protein
MKRRLLISTAAVGIFALGAFAGSFLENRAHSQMYRTMCLAPFVESGSEGLLTMNLLAQGRVDSAYDLAEDRALLCAALVNAVHPSPAMVSCAANLRGFYDRYPDRKANLERQHPAAAKRLGVVASP